MRLGVLSQWYDPEPGGGAVPGVLARGLAGRGHDVRVLTGFPNYPRGQIYPGYRQRWRHLERPGSGVSVRRVPLVPSHDQNPATRAANYLSFGASAAAQVDRTFADRDALWVYNSPATVGAVARGVSRRQRLPFLLHVMDVWPDSVLDSGMLSGAVARRSIGAALGRVVRRTHEAASLVAVTSPGQRDLLLGRGVPAAKLRYIPVWADEDVFFPRPTERGLLPLPARRAPVVLMYAGAMGHVQRLDVALRAVAAVGADVHLVLVGSGVAEQELRDLARELDADNVHFMGRQPAAAMGELSAAADLHLVSLADTPLMRVTMPSKIQSIMALGKPILATCAGDAAETVRRASAGLAVGPGPGASEEIGGLLRSVVRDPTVLGTWGRAARTYYLAEFAREKALSRVEEGLAAIAGA